MVSVTVSTPGKALIAGGYVVLESPNKAITISVSARFYVTTTLTPHSQPSGPEKEPSLEILVKSPQFHTSYEYVFHTTNDTLDLKSELGNEFVAKCLSVVFKFAKHHMGEKHFNNKLAEINSADKMEIILEADNDFYSHISKLKESKLPLLSSSLRTLPRFLPCDLDSNGQAIVSKTGMGSSAALTTSLVGSLLQWFGVIHLGSHSSDEDLRIVHNVAQLAHSIAQGKIGSGFDVSAAVYGSQIFSRFSAEKVHLCLEPNCSAQILHDTIMNPDLWTQTIQKFQLPPCLNIVMGDICCGASSSSMAKKVLDWRSSGESANNKWMELVATNDNIAKMFGEIAEYSTANPQDYHKFIDWASSCKSESWAQSHEHAMIANKFLQLKQNFSTARRLLRNMGIEAGVEIEPDEQTELANATEELEGVLVAAVPGAGGRDALFCITLSDEVRNRVESLWCQWGNSSGKNDVCALLLQAVSYGSGIQLE